MARWQRGWWRLHARTLAPDATLGPTSALSSPTRGVFGEQSLASGPAGAVAGVTTVVRSRPAGVNAELFTWTPRTGWSARRTVPTVVAGSLSTAAGSGPPDGASALVMVQRTRGRYPITASLRDPTPRGPAGIRVAGRILTCTPPTFTPAPATRAYRWFSGTTPIPNATRPTFTAPRSFVGRYLRCRVTGATQGFLPGVRYSAYVRVR